MKVYVYYHQATNNTSCFLEEQLKNGSRLIQTIEAEPTEEPITEFQSNEINIGEVFACNNYFGNLKRIS